MALLVSAALHLALLTAHPPFWQMEKPSQPKLKDWRVDVTVQLRGETIPTATPPLGQDKVPKTANFARLATPTQALPESPSATQVAPQDARPAPGSVAAPAAQPAAEQAPGQQAPATQQLQAFAGAMNNLVNAQYVLGQMKLFFEQNRDHLKSAALGLLTEDQMRHFAGAVCSATLTYATADSEAVVLVDCGTRPELADILRSRINWSALPQPQKYSLDYRGLTITLWLDGYQIRVGLKSEG
jgi:hypothetical protein